MRAPYRHPVWGRRPLAGARFMIPKDGPLSVIIFQGTEILDPVARIHIDDLDRVRTEAFDLGLMNVTTHDVAIALAASGFHCYLLKVTDIFDCQLDTAFDAVGQRYTLSTQCHQ